MIPPQNSFFFLTCLTEHLNFLLKLQSVRPFFFTIVSQYKNRYLDR